ncbi:hypothetical protein D3C73_1104030 [compost metagenome]
MPKALNAKVWLAVMPKVFCIMVGVMTTNTTTAEVSTQVRIMAGRIARRCSRSTVRSGNSTAASRLACIAMNTGVSLSQRRNQTPITPNTPPSRNG